MRKVQKPQASVLNAAWVFSIRTLADCVSQKPDAAGRLPRTFRESCLLITAQAHTCPTHLEHCCPITHPSHNQKYSRGHRNRHTQEACSEHKYAPFQEQGTKYNLKYGCSFQLFFLICDTCFDVPIWIRWFAMRDPIGVQLNPFATIWSELEFQKAPLIPCSLLAFSI